MRHRLGGCPVIASEHDDAQTVVTQRLQRRRRILLDRIGDAENAVELAVDREKDHGRAVAPQTLGVGSQRSHFHAALGEKFVAAKRDLSAVRLCRLRPCRSES